MFPYFFQQLTYLVTPTAPVVAFSVVPSAAPVSASVASRVPSIRAIPIPVPAIVSPVGLVAVGPRISVSTAITIASAVGVMITLRAWATKVAVPVATTSRGGTPAGG